MRLWLILSCTFLICHSTFGHYDDIQDNEFAEFEDFEEESETVLLNEDEPEKRTSSNEKSNKVKEEQDEVFVSDEEDQDEAVVDDEEDIEFEHFQDVEEFEGFDVKEEKPVAEPKITIAKVPLNLKQNWDSYYLEILMLTGLLVYFMNFALGKTQNTKIANAWFQTHRQLLEENFALVGDDGNLDRNENTTLIKESENIFTLWCSGRTCCEGMLVELKLIKRQDLVSVIAGMMRPIKDQVHFTVKMNKEDMDTFIFAAASKKTAAQLAKDMADISVYCPERKPGEKFNIPSSFNVMSEIGEATAAMLDSKVAAVFNKFPEYVEYIHFSDQFSGPKPTEETTSTPLKLPESEKVLRFGFNMPLKGMTLDEAMSRLKPLLTMVFYCMDKVKRYRLSKEGRTKADKNRQRVEEAFLKSTHAARAEAAAAKREEKRRQEKEKILAEEDPEKQRRWEQKEEKRNAKKRAPKMRQMKVKAL